MLKHQEATQPDSDWNKVKDNQGVFILIENDLAAPGTIRDWIQRRITLGLNTAGDDQLTEAEYWASYIEKKQTSKSATQAPATQSSRP